MFNIVGMIGGVFSAGGHIVAANQAAETERRNAEAAERDAQQSLLVAAVDMVEIEKATSYAKSLQRATAAAQGSRADEGSPLVMLMNTAAEGRKAVLRRDYEGKQQALQFRSEASAARHRAHDIKTIGKINAISSVLSGAAVSYQGGQPRATTTTASSGYYGGNLAGTTAGGGYF